jgi:hypothetical protein
MPLLCAILLRSDCHTYIKQRVKCVYVIFQCLDFTHERKPKRLNWRILGIYSVPKYFEAGGNIGPKDLRYKAVFVFKHTAIKTYGESKVKIYNILYPILYSVYAVVLCRKKNHADTNIITSTSRIPFINFVWTYKNEQLWVYFLQNNVIE